MATPIVATAGNAITAVTVNKYLAAGGGKASAKVLWARIRYTGTAWEVHASTDSAEILSGHLAWSTDKLVVTVSGFTVIAAPVVSPTLGNAIYWPKALGASSTAVHVAFYNDAGARQTVQSSNMDCTLLVIGV